MSHKKPTLPIKWPHLDILGTGTIKQPESTVPCHVNAAINTLLSVIKKDTSHGDARYTCLDSIGTRLGLLVSSVMCLMSEEFREPGPCSKREKHEQFFICFVNQHRKSLAKVRRTRLHNIDISWVKSLPCLSTPLRPNAYYICGHLSINQRVWE